MGQQEVLEFLEKVKKPVSRSEIAFHLEIDADLVTHCINKLLKHKEIKCIEIDRIQAKAFFKGKAPTRRMRLYYV